MFRGWCPHEPGVAEMDLVVAGGSPIERTGIAGILECEGWTVTATVADVNALPSQLAWPTARVAILIGSPGQLHLESVQRLALHCGRDPRLRLLFLVPGPDPEACTGLLARIPEGIGYLIADRVTVERLVRTVRVVASGDVVVDDGVLRVPPGGAAAKPALTAREQEVVRHVAGGLSNQAVAACLSVSVATVEKHLRSCFDKLGLRLDPDVNRRVRIALMHRSAHSLPRDRWW